MRSRRLLAALVAAPLVLGGAALAAPGALAPSGEVEVVAPDESLTAALAAAGPDELVGVLVHGDRTDAVVDALESVGITTGVRFDRIGVVQVLATPAQVAELGDLDAVTHLEHDAPLAYHDETSHVATRGIEVQEGFSATTTEDVEVCEPGPAGKGKGKGADKGKGKDKDKGTGDPVCTTETRTVDVEVPGYDGSGVGIAIIDTGIDGTHDMFATEDGGSRVKVNLKYYGSCGVTLNSFLPGSEQLPCFGPADQGFEDAERLLLDPPGNDTDTISAGGHGTHVATIAGGGPISLDSGEVITGAAPGADVYGLSAGDAITVGSAVAAQYWVLENHAAPCDGVQSAEVAGTPAAGTGTPAVEPVPTDCAPIRVVNNSYGSEGEKRFNPESATSKIQRQLADEGVVMVWAAGNDGGDGSVPLVSDDGTDPYPGILAVANYDDGNVGTRDGSLSGSSSRGLRGDIGTYPDLAAPGTDITAGCNPFLPICRGVETRDVRAGTISGTSMAAPHVAGIVAQLFQVAPEATPAQIEDVLEDTAHQFGGGYEPDLAERNDDHTTSFDKGHGLVDAKAAVAALLGLDLGEGDGDGGPVCVADADVVVDAGGDSANGITGTSNANTDLLGAGIAGDVDAITFTFRLDDLDGTYSEGTTGQFWDLGFSFGDTDLLVVANRAQLDGVPPAPVEAAFELAQSRQTVETLATGLTGTYDVDTDEITVTVTQADLDAANAAIAARNAEPGATVEPLLPALADLPYLSDFVLSARESTYVVAGSLLSTVDTAAGRCAYRVGTGVIDLTEVPTDDGTGGDGGDGGDGGTGTEPVDAPEGYEGPVLGLGDGAVTTLTWSGSEPAAPAVPLAGADDCVLSVDLCDRYEFFLDVPGSVTFTGTFDELDDWDFFLYDEDGEAVAQAASADVPETFTVELAPGLHDLRAMPYTAAESYTGTLTLAVG